MGRREIEEQESEEGEELCNCGTPEVPLPRSRVVAVQGRDWCDGHGNEGGDVSNDDPNVSPFVRQQLRQRKSRHLKAVLVWCGNELRIHNMNLTVGTAEPRDSHSRNHRICVLGGSNDNVADRTNLEQGPLVCW